MMIALAEDMARSTTDISDELLERWLESPVLFFRPGTIVYKQSTAFVEFNFTFLFIHYFTCQH